MENPVYVSMCHTCDKVRMIIVVQNDRENAAEAVRNEIAAGYNPILVEDAEAKCYVEDKGFCTHSHAFPIRNM